MTGFGVYVHWPYCAHICPYCDFNVYRARGADAAPLIAAICADIEEHAARFGARKARSVFLGGGTPSLLSGREIDRIVDAVQRAFGLESDCEITLEANPEDASRVAEQVAAGVNRLSVGVQALDDGALKALGRWHDADAAIRAVEAAARTGARVSLDLIYAREGQGAVAWRAELERALVLPIEHASLYQLTIEGDTAFARRAARGQINPPDAALAAELYEVTRDVCEAAGFHGYEISNHARSAAARARHNELYWTSAEWIGVGPGAHGRMLRDGARIATEAQQRSSDYIDAVREHGVGWITEGALSPEQAADEMLLMGLRIDEGVDLARVEALRGRPIAADALAWLVEQGLVAHASGRVRLTPQGRLLADRVSAELAA